MDNYFDYIQENELQNTLKVATVFSGIGSFEHALIKKNIKHEIIFACDIDKFCKINYIKNYKINPENWYNDIKLINGKKYLNQIDILVGGSPCQSFSTAGNKKGLEDERGNLIFEFIRLVNEIKPKMFIYENVKGILNHKKGETFNYIYSKFEELNYHMEKSILNAKDYGIPQNRERLFIIGYKNHCFKDMNVIQKMISNKIQQTLIVKDFLDENIEEKYYIKSQLWQKYITNDYQLGKSKVSINPKTAICLTARQYANWAGNYLLCFKNDKINFDLNDEVVERIKDLNILSYDINYIKHNLIFRRLTPKEILKLMGYDTNIFKTYVSDAQTYKQAGNSIVSSIFENMIPYILDIWIS